jgi:formate hydrogenlyase subunit 3/multisubunit Na+/H+ antiporter MnhD subunit
MSKKLLFVTLIDFALLSIGVIFLSVVYYYINITYYGKNKEEEYKNTVMIAGMSLFVVVIWCLFNFFVLKDTKLWKGNSGCT